MQMCQEHWDELKLTIGAVGMSHLISKNADEAIKTMTQPVPGEEPGFDPLAICAMDLYMNAIRNGGMYLLTEKPEGGHYCPICEAEAHGGHDWIGLAVRHYLGVAREKGLMPAIQ